MVNSAQWCTVYIDCQFLTDELTQLFWYVMCEKQVNWYDN